MSNTYYDDYYEERRRGGFLGKLLALFLGFLLGIISTIGGIAGFGYYVAYKAKIGKLAGYAGVDAETLGKYLSSEYHDYTILGLIQAEEVKTLASALADGTATFEMLETFSPAVRTAADNFASLLSRYGADVTTDDVMKVTLSGNGISTFVTDTVQTVELGALLGNVGVEMNDLLMSLCYGTEGVDYKLDGNGKPVMLGDSKATTIGTFMNGEIQPALEKVSLEAIMSLGGTIDYDDSVIRALLYGEEGVTYEYDASKSDPVTMLPLSYKVTDGASIDTPDGKTFVFDAARGKYITDDAEDGYIEAYSGAKSGYSSTAATGTTGSTGTEAVGYRVYDKDGKLFAELKKTAKGDYNAYKGDAVLLHTPTSISTLLGGDFRSLLSNFRLADFLQAGVGSDEIILALCYGEKGVDWEIKNGKIEMIGDAKPTSIEALTGDNSQELFNGMVIGTLLNVSPEDKTMSALAYGKEGKHYKVVTESGKAAVEMLPIVYTLKDGVFYDDDKNAVFTSSPLSGGVYSVTVEKNEDGNATYVTYTAKPAPAEDGVQVGAGETAYYLYETATAAKPVTYKKRTLADFRGGTDELLNEIEVATILGIDHTSDSVMIALAYGTEGVDFKFIYEGGKKTGIQPINAPRTIADLTSGDITSTIQLASVLTPDKDDSVTMYLLYGVKGVHYKIGTDGEAEMLGMRIAVGKTATGENVAFDESGKQLVFGAGGSVQAVSGAENTFEYTYRGEKYAVVAEEANKYGTDVYTAADGSTIPYYAATKDGVKYVYEPRTIADLSGEYSPVSTITDDLKIGDFAKDSSSGLMNAIKDWRISDLSDQSKIKSLEIADIITIDDSSSALLQTFKNNHWTIDDLGDQSKIDGLKIGDIMEIDEHSSGLLQQIAGKTIADLNDQATIDGIELAAVLGIDPATSGNLMLALAYGTKGVHYDLTASGEVTMLAMRIAIDEHGGVFSAYDERGNELTAGDGKDVYKNGGYYYYNYRGKTYKITATAENEHGTVYTRADGSTVPYYIAFTSDEGGNDVQYFYEKRTIADIKDDGTINSLMLGDVIEIQDDDAHLLRVLANTPIGNLSTKINQLTIGDLLEEGSDYGRFLSHLKGSTLDSLANDLQALTLQEVYEEQVYVTASKEGDVYKTFTSRAQYQSFLADIENGGDGAAYTIRKTVTAEEAANGVYYVIDKNTRVWIKYNENYAVEGQTLQVRDKYYVPGTETVSGDLSTAVYVKPALTGSWKYLLSKDKTNYNELSSTSPATVNFEELDCTLSQMDKLMENMSENIKHAKLKDLNEDMGLGLDQDFLKIELIENIVNKGLLDNSGAANSSDPKWRKRWLFNEMHLLIEQGKTSGATPEIKDISIEELSLYFTVLMDYYNSLPTFPSVGP